MMRYLILLLFFAVATFSQENKPKDEKLKILKMYTNSDEQQKILLLKMLIQNNSQNIESLKATVQQLQKNMIVVKKSEDERFWVYKDGIILDNHTGMEWRIGDNKDTNYFQAEKFVKNLGGNWRLPTRHELRQLYDEKKKSGEHAKRDPIFGDGHLVWSADKSEKENEACGFTFSGNYDFSWPKDSYQSCRVFGVRSGIQQLQKDITSLTVIKTSEDRRFWLHKDKVILDTHTGLEWCVGPNRDTNHFVAEEFMKKKNFEGNWRWPTIEELKELYDPQKNSGRHAKIDPIFAVGDGYLVWLEERKTKNGKLVANFFYFSQGSDVGTGDWPSCDYAEGCRVFGVRLRKTLDSND